MAADWNELYFELGEIKDGGEGAVITKTHHETIVP